MKNRFFVFLLCIPILTWTSLLNAQEEPIAFIGATIYPIEETFIENGVLIIQGGVITAIGDSRTRIPRGAVINDVTGKVIIWF